MAQTAATQTSEFGGFLRPEVAENYFKEAAKQSVVQGLARRVPLGINGKEIPFTTSKPTASWTAEAGQKPTTNGSLGLKTMKPAKLTAISVVSAEVVRANPGGYMETLREDITEAFALAFDAAALHGTNTPFASYIDQTTKSVELGSATTAAGGIYADVNAGLKLLLADKKKLTGFAFDVLAEGTFNDAVDANGRPLFVDAPYERSSLQSGLLLRRPALLTDGIATDVVAGTPNTGGLLGYGGNWDQVIWGAVGGITYDVSTQATVTLNGELVSLWEHNLVAIRAEAEYGLLVNDVESFVKYTDHTS